MSWRSWLGGKRPRLPVDDRAVGDERTGITSCKQSFVLDSGNRA